MKQTGNGGVSVRWPLLAAMACACLAFAVDTRLGVYAAHVTDSSAYVAAGDLWRTGEIFRPVPLQLWGHWPGAYQSLSSLGFRPSFTRGIEVTEYPFGYPMLIAAATAAFGPLAAYLVAPAMHAILVAAAYSIGRRLGGELAGVVAAWSMAANPVAVMHGIHPMSDVPAAASWMAAWALGLGPGLGAMAASGLLASLAVMIRPNLAPLAGVLAVAWLWADTPLRQWRTWQWQRAVLFGVCASIGPLLVAWSQYLFYGGVATSGYPGAAAFFRLSHAAANLATYPSLFVLVHGGLPLLGALLPVYAVVQRSSWTIERRRLLLTGMALAVVNAGAYLFYLPYDTAPFLRFFLVVIAVLFIAYATVVAAIVRSVWGIPVVRWIAPLLAVASLWPSVRRPDLWRFLESERSTYSRVQALGEYAEASLPSTAVVLGFLHTGSIASYTGHNVLRLDLVPASDLDATVAALAAGGASPVFVLDEQLDEPQLRERFKGTRYGALDWPPRAEFVSKGRIRYWVASDRDRYLAGERWSTDVLR